MSLKCCVIGCRSNSETPNSQTRFYTLPSVASNPENVSTNALRKKRKREWAKAVFGAAAAENCPLDIVVCSKHFVSGWPAQDTEVDDVDWVPNQKLTRIACPAAEKAVLDRIIDNLPEVMTKFDVPEYIVFNPATFRETAIEKHLVKKYLTNPICDENGYYSNDHDYLGLPLAPVKTEISNYPKQDHNYAVSDRPACQYFDSRNFCNICSCSCDNIFTFNKHLTAHTLKNHVTCRFCLRTYLTSTCLNNHLNVHITVCDKCGNEVPTVQLKAHHMVNNKQRNKHPDSRKYKVWEKSKVHFCVKCMKGSSDLKTFEKHLCFKKMQGLKRLKML